MTKIMIIKSRNGEYREVVCKGHAGYAEAGSDIICSAVSILIINTINSLDVLTNAPMKVQSDEGTGYIRCQFTKSLGKGSILLLDSMVLGLQAVASQYGKKYLSIKFKEV